MKSRRIAPEIVAANKEKRRLETLAKRKIYDTARAEAKRLARASTDNPMKRRASPGQGKPKPPKPIVIAKPRPAPAYHRWSPETEAVNPNNVPVTRLPTPKPRFHCEPPASGFASLGVGRYE